jgi:excinuclease ABC subunit C
MVGSVLDDVDGVGPARRKALLRHFGSVKKMRQADISDLADVVPDKVARALYQSLHEV